MQILMLKLIFCLPQYEDLISGHVEFGHVSENVKPPDPQPVSTLAVALVIQKVWVSHQNTTVPIAKNDQMCNADQLHP